MAAYKKIQGNPIKPQGGKPKGKMFDGGVVGHVQRNINIKSIHNSISGSVNKEGFFMGKQASGPNTVFEARGKHLA